MPRSVHLGGVRAAGREANMAFLRNGLHKRPLTSLRSDTYRRANLR